MGVWGLETSWPPWPSWIRTGSYHSFIPPVAHSKASPISVPRGHASTFIFPPPNFISLLNTGALLLLLSYDLCLGDDNSVSPESEDLNTV